MSNRLYSSQAEVHYLQKDGFFTSFLYLVSGTYECFLKPIVNRVTGRSGIESRANSNDLDVRQGNNN